MTVEESVRATLAERGWKFRRGRFSAQLHVAERLDCRGEPHCLYGDNPDKLMLRALEKPRG